MSISIDALSAVRRASQVHYEQMCARRTLNCGIAFYSHPYAALPWMNQVREVVIPPGRTMQEAYDEVEACFADLGLACERWVPAATQAPEPIEAFLSPRGFTTDQRLTMLLVHAVEPAPRPDVRILPARAMRKAYAELIGRDERYAPDFREALIASHLDRLDDPQYDLFVAQIKGRLVGRGALFQVGDIARVENLVIDEPFRGQGVGRSLMAHLTALARRLAMRSTCLEVIGEDPRLRRFCESCGFEAGPTYVQFHKPPKTWHAL